MSNHAPGIRGQRRSLASLLFLLTLLAVPIAHAQNQGQPRSPLDEVLAKLAVIEAKVDALAAEQVTATFCISQGREFGLGADWIAVVDQEWEAGIGWAEVFSGEGTAELKLPTSFIPSETTIGVGGSHGRGMEICIDLPIEMGPTDTALLAELAAAINAKADDFPNRGKFQRRAHRLLNYTKRRVPGIQTRTLSAPTNTGFTTAEEPDGADDEFDRIDEAVENILAGGVVNSGPLGVFKNANVRTIADSFGGLPSNIRMLIDNPDQIWDPLSNTISNRGINGMRCDTFGIDAATRSGRDGLDQLCNRLEGLPSYADVESILSGELIGALFEALDTLTITSNAAQVSSESKSRFCTSLVGRRPRFDDFCGRP